MRMVKTIPAAMMIALVALVAGCATQTKYMPAEKRGAYGYTDTQLTERRYRVTFTGNSLTPRETVQDYALLRAAELTLENGYDWFKLANRETDKKTRNGGGSQVGVGVAHHEPRTYRRCGLLSCDSVTTYDTHVSTTVGSGGSRESYASSIEIVLGKDPMPEEVEAYDAQELASTLRRWMEQPKQ